MLRKVSQSFTRPADTNAYQDADLVANSTTAGSVTPMQFQGFSGGWRIVNARVSKTDETDVANATFTLHIYGSSPTPANGDNGALSTNLADKLGSIAFGTMTAFTDEGAALINVGATALPEGIYGTSQVFYALLEAKGAYAPASEEVFTVTLYLEKP
jgi:hypothetical protein